MLISAIAITLIIVPNSGTIFNSHATTTLNNQTFARSCENAGPMEITINGTTVPLIEPLFKNSGKVCSGIEYTTYSKHYYAGASFSKTSAISASKVASSILVPTNPPASELPGGGYPDDNFYVVLSAMDSVDNVDQIAFFPQGGNWYPTTNIWADYGNGALTNSAVGPALTPGHTYTFVISASGGYTSFTVLDGDTVIWQHNFHTGANNLILSQTYGNAYDYTVYEEVWNIDGPKDAAPYDFVFQNNYYWDSSGQHAAGWDLYDSGNPAYVTSKIEGNNVFVEDPSVPLQISIVPSTYSSDPSGGTGYYPIQISNVTTGGVPPYWYTYTASPGLSDQDSYGDYLNYVSASTPGTYTLTETAHDNDGNTSTSNPLTLQIYPPSISITPNVTATYANDYVLISNTTSGGVPPYTFNINSAAAYSGPGSIYTYMKVSGNEVTANRSGTYDVKEEVTDQYGISANSSPVELTFWYAPLDLKVNVCYSGPTNVVQVSCNVTSPKNPFAIDYSTLCWGAGKGQVLPGGQLEPPYPYTWDINQKATGALTGDVFPTVPYPNEGPSSCAVQVANTIKPESDMPISVAGLAFLSVLSSGQYNEYGANFTGTGKSVTYTLNTGTAPPPPTQTLLPPEYTGASAILVSCGGGKGCTSFSPPSGCYVPIPLVTGYPENLALALCDNVPQTGETYTVTSAGNVSVSSIDFPYAQWNASYDPQNVTETVTSTSITTTIYSSTEYTPSYCLDSNDAKDKVSCSIKSSSSSSSTFCAGGVARGSISLPAWPVAAGWDPEYGNITALVGGPYTGSSCSITTTLKGASKYVIGLSVKSKSTVEYGGETSGSAQDVTKYNFSYTTQPGDLPDAVALMVSCGDGYGCNADGITPLGWYVPGQGCVNPISGYDIYLYLCNDTEGQTYNVTVYSSGGDNPPQDMSVSAVQFLGGVWACSTAACKRAI